MKQQKPTRTINDTENSRLIKFYSDDTVVIEYDGPIHASVEYELNGYDFKSYMSTDAGTVDLHSESIQNSLRQFTREALFVENPTIRPTVEMIKYDTYKLSYRVEEEGLREELVVRLDFKSKYD